MGKIKNKQTVKGASVQSQSKEGSGKSKIKLESVQKGGDEEETKEGHKADQPDSSKDNKLKAYESTNASKLGYSRKSKKEACRIRIALGIRRRDGNKIRLCSSKYVP